MFHAIHETCEARLFITFRMQIADIRVFPKQQAELRAARALRRRVSVNHLCTSRWSRSRIAWRRSAARRRRRARACGRPRRNERAQIVRVGMPAARRHAHGRALGNARRSAGALGLVERLTVEHGLDRREQRVLQDGAKYGIGLQILKMRRCSVVQLEGRSRWMPAGSSARQTASRIAAASAALNAAGTRIHPCSRKCSGVSGFPALATLSATSDRF